MGKIILTADIGGTNSRFGYFSIGLNDNLSLIDSFWLKTGDHKSIESLLKASQDNRSASASDHIEEAVIAVAGPVSDGRYSSPPYIPWDIDSYECGSILGVKECRLLNDFVAQAFACLSPIVKKARKLIDADIAPNSVLAAVGAGTALGLCALYPAGNGIYAALPSEGGHMSFPFESPEENVFMEFLLERTEDPYVLCNTVVSGRGLSYLHEFLTGDSMSPEQVSSSIDSDSDTFQWFARFYGRMCRSYALQVMALGGIYITGGIAARYPEFVSSRAFVSEFLSSRTMCGLLKKIPVFLNTDEDSGLWGSAMYYLNEKCRDSRIYP